VVGQFKENIPDCKGLTDVAMATKFWPKYGGKSNKTGHNFSYMPHINAVLFWGRVSAISEFTYDTPVHKGQKALLWQQILGQKLL